MEISIVRQRIRCLVSSSLLVFAALFTPAYSAQSCAGYPVLGSYCDVPLVAVIANPERFDGMKLAVAGYYQSRWEMSALFMVKDYAELGVTTGAMWVDWRSHVVVAKRFESAGDAAAEVVRELAHQGLLLDSLSWHSGYVRALGVFRAGRGGHLGAYDGQLDNAVLMELTPLPSEDTRPRQR